MNISILRKSSALLLRFADASALWLSRFGSALVAPAKAGSTAHVYASAHAQREGWEVLSERRDWPVPKPCEPGDWLTAPVLALSALRARVLRFATVECLPGSSLELDRIRDQIQKHEGTMVASFPIPSRPRRFILFSESCSAQSAEELACQIAHLDAVIEKDPDVPVLLFDSENSLRAFSPEDLQTALCKLLERALEEGSAEISYAPSPM